MAAHHVLTQSSLPAAIYFPRRASGPDRRLLVAVAGGALAGWVHLERHSSPVIAHWGLISHLQTLPAVQGQGIGGALMTHARQVARQEMGLEQLHLAVRGGMGLEHFCARLGWREIGRWPGRDGSGRQGILRWDSDALPDPR